MKSPKKAINESMALVQQYGRQRPYHFAGKATDCRHNRQLMMLFQYLSAVESSVQSTSTETLDCMLSTARAHLANGSRPTTFDVSNCVMFCHSDVILPI